MFRRYLRSFRAYSLKVSSTFAEVPTIRGVVYDPQEARCVYPIMALSRFVVSIDIFSCKVGAPRSGKQRARFHLMMPGKTELARKAPDSLYLFNSPPVDAAGTLSARSSMQARCSSLAYSSPYGPPIALAASRSKSHKRNFLHFRGDWPFYSGREVASHLR